MFGATTPTQPLRLCALSGYDGRTNDVLYCHPAAAANVEKPSTVVYFGGDVQDFYENMDKHRDNKNYQKWSLENTATIMQSCFINSHIVVIRPSRMDYKTFSCFDNFVPSGNCGVPEHAPMNYAVQHLEKLLQNISTKLLNMSECDINEALEYLVKMPQDVKNNEVTPELTKKIYKTICLDVTIELDKYDIVLVGFSKGCVVLNQFLYEFHYMKTLTPDDSTMMGVISKIKEMYWLDGGHSGGKNTWINSKPLLETFSRLGIRVHIHVSPYQIEDDRRPWIKKEEKQFFDVLCRLGAPVERVVHFANMPPNLFSHFDILTVFKENQISNTVKT